MYMVTFETINLSGAVDDFHNKCNHVVLNILMEREIHCNRNWSLWVRKGKTQVKWLIIICYFFVQNSTIDLGNNVTVISQDIRDNPDLEFYTLIYGMGIIAMVVFTLLRAFLFMKVCCSSLSLTVSFNVWPYDLYCFCEYKSNWELILHDR